jgi:hypothetical protein
MNVSAFEQAALHVCKVAAWVIGSAAIPALLALYTQNPYWLALTPFINGIGAGLEKWSGIQAAAAKQSSAQ